MTNGFCVLNFHSATTKSCWWSVCKKMYFLHWLAHAMVKKINSFEWEKRILWNVQNLLKHRYRRNVTSHHSFSFLCINWSLTLDNFYHLHHLITFFTFFTFVFFIISTRILVWFPDWLESRVGRGTWLHVSSLTRVTSVKSMLTNITSRASGDAKNKVCTFTTRK